MLHWFSNADFSVHPDSNVYIGGIVPIGKRDMIDMSKKKMINTKISTEVEIVGVDDVMPQII